MTPDETRALVVAELRTAAEQSSRIQRQMAEGKSLRNSDGERRDLYMWPEPAQTLEGRAADLIERRPTPWKPDREAVARVIDPVAFKSWQNLFDYCLRCGDSEPDARRTADATHLPGMDRARAKADAILALGETP